MFDSNIKFEKNDKYLEMSWGVYDMLSIKQSNTPNTIQNVYGFLWKIDKNFIHFDIEHEDVVWCV